MDTALQSLQEALSKLCEKKGLHIGKATPLEGLEKIDKFEAMNGCACLKKLYVNANPKWKVFLPTDKTKDVSFTVYYKNGKGGRGLAILEMTPAFCKRFSLSKKNSLSNSFWEIIEEDCCVPIYGIVWMGSGMPYVCHCGD
jgi:hypothetical protein